MSHPFNPNDGKVEKFTEKDGEIVSVNSQITESGQARLFMLARLFNFTIDSARIKKAHEDFLRDEVAPLLIKNQRLVCLLVGSATNDKAGAAYNQKKGRERAGDVHGFLVVKQKVNADQLRIREAGDVRGAFGAQREEDRAVDVVVVEPASKLFSIRLIEPIQVWQRLGLPAKKNMDQVAFLVEDKLNNLKAIYFLAEDRPELVERIVILANMPGDAGFKNSETVFTTAEAATSTDFEGARVIISPPNATPKADGEPEVMDSVIAGARVGGIFAALKAKAVSFPIDIPSFSGRMVRAILGQSPKTPSVTAAFSKQLEQNLFGSPGRGVLV